MFLFVIQAFWVFILRMWVFWCAVGDYLKSLNGALHVTVEHRHLGR